MVKVPELKRPLIDDAEAPYDSRPDRSSIAASRILSNATVTLRDGKVSEKAGKAAKNRNSDSLSLPQSPMSALMPKNDSKHRQSQSYRSTSRQN